METIEQQLPNTGKKLEPQSIKARLAQKEIEEWEKYKKNLITEVIKYSSRFLNVLAEIYLFW